MTVIAYRDGVMAADSGVTDSAFNANVGTADKICSVNGWLIGFAGSLVHGQLFARWMRGSKREPTWDQFHGLVVRPDGKVLEFDHDKAPLSLGTSHGIAIGPGGLIATAAMMAGADAVRAVEIAIQLDNGCAGPLKIIKQ